MEANVLGVYVTADPNICHGQVTIRGTRIFVQDVLEMVAEGLDWDHINRQWHGRVGWEAIAEAIRVAARALDEYESACAAESEQVMEMIIR